MNFLRGGPDLFRERLMKLVMGNKNYSSWSLRPWLTMRHAGIEFEEAPVRLFTPEFAPQVAQYSKARHVPILVDGDLKIWDSLAICEYLAETFPEKNLWPTDVAKRAEARSVAAEMHSGFSALRQNLPMNIRASLPTVRLTNAVQRDIDRIVEIWTDLRSGHGADGPFLFGEFSIADAFYAPVATRFHTYQVALPAQAQAYVDHIRSLPAMQAWIAGANTERDFLVSQEPYRTAPDFADPIFVTGGH